MILKIGGEAGCIIFGCAHGGVSAHGERPSVLLSFISWYMIGEEERGRKREQSEAKGEEEGRGE